MKVTIHPAAQEELDALRKRSVPEYVAMQRAIRKLKLFGIALSFPFASHVEGTDLWELRPLAGRSAWRALYRRAGDELRIGAIGPDAKVDRRGFRAAIKRALARLEAD